MSYRLIVADLDGTLMGDDITISPAVIAAVRAAMECGLYFTIATGRTFGGTRAFADQLGVNAPLILYQGAEIRHAETGEVLHQVTVPLPWAHEFIATVSEQGLHLNVYLDDRAYAAQETPESQFYASLQGGRVYAVGDLLRFVDRPPMKMLIIGEPARLDQLAPALRAQFAGRLQIVRSYARFLEAIPAGVSKGHGLAWLARYLGIRQEETVAIGDNDNDVEMVQWAGLGIAMGNASAAVKQAADLIAPPVAHDGVAWAIETHILPHLQGVKP